jgi:antitoxin YobK
VSLEDYREAASLISSHSDSARFGRERAAELVERAEAVLGVRFPPSYRTFVRELGAGDVAGEEFYGITSDEFVDSSVPNGIWLTLREREDSGLPEHLVIVYEDDEGDYYTLDTSKEGSESENPVVLWIPGASQPDDDLEQVADDFGTFFRETVEEGLSRRGLI